MIPYKDTIQSVEVQRVAPVTVVPVETVTTGDAVPFKSGHTYFWRLQGSTLTRVHKRKRKQMFHPDQTQSKDCPVPLEAIKPKRRTYMLFEDLQREEVIEDEDWTQIHKWSTEEFWTGRT